MNTAPSWSPTDQYAFFSASNPRKNTRVTGPQVNPLAVRAWRKIGPRSCSGVAMRASWPGLPDDGAFDSAGGVGVGAVGDGVAGGGVATSSDLRRSGGRVSAPMMIPATGRIRHPEQLLDRMAAFFFRRGAPHCGQSVALVLTWWPHSLHGFNPIAALLTRSCRGPLSQSQTRLDRWPSGRITDCDAGTDRVRLLP